MWCVLDMFFQSLCKILRHGFMPCLWSWLQSQMVLCVVTSCLIWECRHTFTDYCLFIFIYFICIYFLFCFLLFYLFFPPSCRSWSIGLWRATLWRNEWLRWPSERWCWLTWWCGQAWAAQSPPTSPNKSWTTFLGQSFFIYNQSTIIWVGFRRCSSILHTSALILALFPTLHSFVPHGLVAQW